MSKTKKKSQKRTQRRVGKNKGTLKGHTISKPHNKFRYISNGRTLVPIPNTVMEERIYRNPFLGFFL